MSVRTWEVPPSSETEIDGVTYPVVTGDDLAQALVEAAVLLNRAGGCLGVIQDRVPTGVPKESVTVRALVSWQERTNAKAQPEPDARRAAENGAPAVDNLGVIETVESSPEGVDEVGDGLFIDPDAEDVSSIPAALRG